MNISDLDLDELEDLLDKVITELGDTKNAIVNIEGAINDINNVTFDGSDSIFNDLIQIKDDLESAVSSMELDIEEIQGQIQMLEDSADDDPNERYREYREMQGF